MPPTTHIARTSELRPRSAARNPVVVKMPVPIILATTRAMALKVVNSRLSDGGIRWLTPANGPFDGAACTDKRKFRDKSETACYRANTTKY